MKAAVVVGGAVARRVEYGGHVWALLQWAVGMRSLGWPVLFLDRLDPAPAGEQEPRVARFVDAMGAFGLQDAFSLDLGSGREPVGRSRAEVLEAVADADFLLNIMGYIDDPEVLGAARRRVFLDIDPGFPQMWAELGYCDMFAGHDVFATVGANLGQDGCSVPTRGLDWIAVRPPVVLDLWTPSDEVGQRFTSVGSWRGPWDPVVYRGRTYGLRVHEFRRFATVPRASGVPMEVALDIGPEDADDADLLRAGGWALVDPGDVAADPMAYRRYVRASRAEFMVAKGMYVQSRSGWVSDRTACYLAAGRPALVQDTGLENDLGGGEGLVTFSTPGEAVDGARRVDAAWHRHAAAARELAAAHFDARRVLAGLADAVQASATPAPTPAASVAAAAGAS